MSPLRTLQQRRRSPLIKWEDLPRSRTYRVETVFESMQFATDPHDETSKIMEFDTYAILRRDNVEYRVWLPNQVLDELEDCDWDANNVYIHTIGTIAWIWECPMGNGTEIDMGDDMGDWKSKIVNLDSMECRRIPPPNMIPVEIDQ